MGPRQSNAESQKARGLISRCRFGFCRSVGGDVSRPGPLALGRAVHYGWNVEERPRLDLWPIPTAARISGLSAPATRRCASENIMKKRTERRKPIDELRREYDLSKLEDGVRGKYATRYQAGTNLVLLSPDVAKYFPDEQSVNMALRKLIHVTKVKKIS